MLPHRASRCRCLLKVAKPITATHSRTLLDFSASNILVCPLSQCDHFFVACSVLYVVELMSHCAAELFHIFNLCSERSYDASHFNGRVTRIKTDDHNPPLLSDLVTFVEQANQFLGEPEPHVIAVHCLGGKGRTGVFVCAWLMYSCFSDTAQGAMTHFSKKRTGGQAKAVQGVSGASQRRYLHYFQQALEFGGYRTSRIFINKIVLHTCPHMDPDGGCDPWFTIEQNGEFIYNSKDSIGVSNFSAEEQSFEMDLGRVALMGDIRIVFYDNDLVPPRDELMCFTWFHTGFVGRTHVTIPKAEVDMACSDRKNKVFDENFAISLHFEEIPEELEFTRAQSDRSGYPALHLATHDWMLSASAPQF
jgi:hypothetical protein